MFRKKSIDEWAMDYWLLQMYAKFCYHIFFKKIRVVNLNNLPKDQPLILAPNHQNALMDALDMVLTTRYQIVFLARADIFKGKLLIRFLNYLNIMPIYRIRDGFDNVRRNDEVFEKTTRVLLNKLSPLGIFPEGNHGDRRRLRSLVKGIFRIAFMAQEEYGDKPGVKIVPVGIDYGHYQNFRTTLLVNYGKPIEVSDYFNLYKEDAVRGVNKLKDRLIEEMRILMIDIQTEEYYDLYMSLRKVFNHNMLSHLGIQGKALEEKFAADKKMIAMLDRELESNPETLKELKTLMSEYENGLKKLDLRDWIVRKTRGAGMNILLRSFYAIILFPVFIVGLVNNYLPYYFPVYKTKDTKDPQFKSSFKFVIGMIVFPLWYIVLTVICLFLPVSGWFKLIYLLLMPVTGLISFNYYINFKKLKSSCLFSLLQIKKDKRVTRLKELRNAIIAGMNTILLKYYPTK